MGVAISNEHFAKNQQVKRMNDNYLLTFFFLFLCFHEDLEITDEFDHLAFLRENIDKNELFSIIWEIFSQNEICSTLEVLACLILLCDGDWRERLGLLFDLFKSPCTSDITKDDIMLSVEIITEGLKKLWRSNDDQTGTAMSSIELADQREELQSLAESLAGSAFIKLGKDADDGIMREEYQNWGMDKFKSSKIIASVEGLHQLFS